MTVARTDATILIRGENGVGKEVFTKLIHNNSPRREKPFITSTAPPSGKTDRKRAVRL
jgi:transcriptional regulator with PAS, ATPase and Fis domain